MGEGRDRCSDSMGEGRGDITCHQIVNAALGGF